CLRSRGGLEYSAPLENRRATFRGCLKAVKSGLPRRCFDGILATGGPVTRKRWIVRAVVSARSWYFSGVLALLALLVARPASPQLFRSFSTDPRNILEGNWQSCRESDGRYSERVYDHVVNGVAQFEVHLGPRYEFALFPGVQDAHR